MSRYRLVPDDKSLSTKEVLVATGLVINPNEKILAKYEDKFMVKQLLLKLQQARIGCNSDGILTFRGKSFKDFKYDEAICDLYEMNIDYKYEPLYQLIRKCRIGYPG